MNPHEHGEVYVLADGAEVDMDFGHYERFMGGTCSGGQSISMGKIYAGILEKERR
jgi:CTP synthase